MNVKRVIICIAIGVLVTPIAVFLAIASAGAGHGHYVWAKLFFPYTLLMPHFFPDRTAQYPNSITAPWIILAFVQFPFYGTAIGLATRTRMATYLVCSLILLLHAIGIVLCFSGAVPNFS